MSYTVNLYAINKKINSTKRPGGNGSTFSCNIVYGSTQQNPSFRLSESLKTLYSYNYMKFLNQCYYITDIESERDGVSIIHATLDPLATYRSDISSYEAYVTRTSNTNQIAYYDNDNIIQATNVKTSCKENTIATGFSFTSGTIISITTYGASGVQYDLVNSDIQSLTNDLFDNVQDLWDSLYQKLTSPSQYVKNLILLPYSFNLDFSVGTIIKLGNAPSVNISNALNITDTTRLKTKTYTLLVSSLKTNCTYNASPIDYRLYNNQFTRIEALIPFVGKIAIPNEVFNFHEIQVKYSIDVVTGQGECLVVANTGTEETNPQMVIHKSTINFGASIPLCASYDNKASIFKDVATGNLVGIASDVMNPKQNMSMIGSIDGVGYNDISKIRFTVTEYESDDISEYIAIKGRPCNKKIQISSLGTGTYIECLNPSVSTEGKSGVNEQINQYLERGFFYE